MAQTTEPDAWSYFENWLEKYGKSEEMDDDPLGVVEEYYQFCQAETLTGDLFSEMTP